MEKKTDIIATKIIIGTIHFNSENSEVQFQSYFPKGMVVSSIVLTWFCQSVGTLAELITPINLDNKISVLHG